MKNRVLLGFVMVIVLTQLMSTISVHAKRPPIANENIVRINDNKYTIKREEIDLQIKNLNKLLNEASAERKMVGGQMTGFHIIKISRNSFFRKIGLKENDVIESINGDKITGITKAMFFLPQLKNLTSLDLGLERNGKKMKVNYQIINPKKQNR